MCDPMTLAVAGLNAVQSMDAISKQNAAAASNRANAIEAQNNELAQSQESYIEQNRSLIQQGFDAILQGRADEATAYASAIENGAQGNSVKAVLRDQKMRTTRNKNRTKQEQESLKTQLGFNFKHIEAKTKGRINSVAPTGFGLGDVASVVSPIVKREMG